VVKLVVEQRQPFQNKTIPFEKLTGRFYGELDPEAPLNAIITDIELAPRNARGMVEYSATVHHPQARRHVQGHGGAHLQRGQPRPRRHRRSPATSRTSAAGARAGDQRLAGRHPGGRRHRDDGHADREEARRSSITGPVVARIFDAPAGATTHADRSRPRHRHGHAGQLRHRQGHADQARSETGSRVPVLSSDWAFADCGQKPFLARPDPVKVCIKGGFDPAMLYELTYIAKDPPVHGIGFATTRDLVSYLRRGETGSPLGPTIRHTVTHGTSQSGNYLRSFLHLGFNQDERGVRVFDGMNTHIAARQLAMNIRFGAPSGAAEMYEAGSEGALWWDDYTDVARGRPSTSLLARCRATETCPKIVETFGSAEFYSLRMSQNMVGTRADRDIPLPPNVRRYYSPSTRHGGGAGGFVNEPAPRRAACWPRIRIRRPNRTAR
jgi:hypothetical protein